MTGLDLDEPEDFSDDAYGYLTNQLGHIWLGVLVPTLYCFVMSKLGEYPNQALAFACVVTIYFLWWELLVQGWRGWDSIEDTFFVSLGASVYLYIDMQYVIDRMFVAFTLMIIFLSFGVIRRLEQEDSDG